MCKSKHLILAVVAAAALFAGSAQRAPAAPTTPFGGPVLQTFIDAMGTLRAMYTEGAETAAIDQALVHFADESKTYSEDINDFRKAVKILRPVFGTDGADPDPKKAFGATVMNQADAYVYTTMLGLANRAYANASPLTRLKLLAKYDKAAQTADENKRMNKFKSFAVSIQAYAKKKRIDLYVSQ